MFSQVITVLGRVAPQEMGVTDAHNHVWISPVECPSEDAPVLDQFDSIVMELADYLQAGGGGQIDCQPFGCGRDGQKLRHLAEQSKVKIVANTGFHLSQYYPPESSIWHMNGDQATEFFLSEIYQGLIETRELEEPVYPGFIKIAVRENVHTSPVPLIEAAVRASLESGLAIEMHTEKGHAVEDFVRLFTKLGLPPGRLVICHIDKRPDLGLHKELAQAGYMLEYDTFLRPKYRPEENLWPLIDAMIEADLSHSLALATDLADGSLWATIGGGPGIVSFITKVKRRLEELAYTSEIFQALTGGNIAARLAVPNEE
jgi:phosphotriesterase-related protein